MFKHWRSSGWCAGVSVRNAAWQLWTEIPSLQSQPFVLGVPPAELRQGTMPRSGDIVSKALPTASLTTRSQARSCLQSSLSAGKSVVPERMGDFIAVYTSYIATASFPASAPMPVRSCVRSGAHAGEWLRAIPADAGSTLAPLEMHRNADRFAPTPAPSSSFGSCSVVAVVSPVATPMSMCLATTAPMRPQRPAGPMCPDPGAWGGLRGCRR